MLVEDIGDALNGSYSKPNSTVVEAALAKVLMVKKFRQHRTRARVVAHQMVTPENVNAVMLCGLRRSGLILFRLARLSEQEVQERTLWTLEEKDILVEAQAKFRDQWDTISELFER